MDSLKVVNAIINSTITQVYVHPVKLNLKWLPIDDEDLLIVNNGLRCDNLPELKTLTWKDKLYPQTELTITNDNDVIPEGAETLCGLYDIEDEEFKWSKHCPHGITVRDLTEAVYRMKRFKYDCTNEFFHELTIKSTGLHSVEFEVTFDYSGE